jgi:hypothetical protein
VRRPSCGRAAGDGLDDQPAQRSVPAHRGGCSCALEPRTPASQPDEALSEDEVLTIDEGAKLLRVGRNQLHEAIGRGTIPVSETGETMPCHSLRHTFGMECAARGVPLPTLKTTMRYVTITDTQKDAAIERACGASGQRLANDARIFI